MDQYASLKCQGVIPHRNYHLVNMPEFKIKNAELAEAVSQKQHAFPKYTTQIMNLANQNAQRKGVDYRMATPECFALSQAALSPRPSTGAHCPV